MNLTHIDTCTADYLLDHHDREGEHLVGIPVDGATTFAEVIGELFDASDACDDDTPDFTGIIREAFADVEDMSAPFAPHLPTLHHEYDDMPLAWFLFTWDAEALA